MQEPTITFLQSGLQERLLHLGGDKAMVSASPCVVCCVVVAAPSYLCTLVFLPMSMCGEGD